MDYSLLTFAHFYTACPFLHTDQNSDFSQVFGHIFRYFYNMSMANMLKSPGWKGTEQMIPWLPFGLHCWQNSTAQELCNNGGLKRVQGDVIQSDLCQALSLKGINSPEGFPDVGSSCSLLQLDGNKTLKGIEGLRLYRQK